MQKGSTQKSFLKNPYLQYIIFGIIISLLPVLVNAGILKTSWVGIIGGTIIYAIAALGLNLLLGYSLYNSIITVKWYISHVTINT